MLTSKKFGEMPCGREVVLYTISNANGFSVSIINFGAIVTEIKAPDASGKYENVVLGFDSLDGYMKNNLYFGAICGRYANRIKHGTFTLDGKTYKLPINNGNNSLHGGNRGFDKFVWKTIAQSDNQLQLQYISADGDEGYPGTLTLQVTYTITDKNELVIDYKAVTDKATVLNVTNHSYFNLAACNESILDHELQIHAGAFTPVDDELIPIGEILPVFDAIDFNQPKRIGNDIESVGGYDHNFVLNGKYGTLRLAAVLTHSQSGRKMSAFTTEPGVQFYSSNFVPHIQGKDGKWYNKYWGVCLEAQHYPDSPNQPKFPSTVLRPGEEYKQTTVYRFETI